MLRQSRALGARKPTPGVPVMTALLLGLSLPFAFAQLIDLAARARHQPQYSHATTLGSEHFSAIAMSPPLGSVGLDPAFGNGGKVMTDFPVRGSGSAADVALQSDGKFIVLGGSSIGYQAQPYNDFVLARYNPDGSLDSSFGENGMVITDLYRSADYATAVAIQHDGKILAAGSAGGDFALARYNPDGTLDLTFSNDGKLRTDFSGGDDSAYDMMVQADGKIVLAGHVSVAPYSLRDFGLARYNPDGTPDTTFDGDGKVTTNFSSTNNSDDQAYAMDIQTDGKIVVAGNAELSNGQTSYPYFALARYNPNGSLDSTFGNGGKVTNFQGGGASAMSIQADGKIVAAGSDAIFISTSNFAVARYNSDGSPDSSFDGDGMVTTSFTSYGVESAYSLAIQQDARIVAAGYTYGQESSDAALVRYNPNGSLDSSFDGDGMVTTDVSGRNDSLSAIVLTPDARILGVGYAGYTYSRIGVVRYTSNGSLDPTLNGSGIVTTEVASSSLNGATAIAIQPDGKVVAAGYIWVDTCSSSCPATDYALARYNVDGRLDRSFGNNGRVTTDVSAFNYDNVTAVLVQPDGKIVVAGIGYSSGGQDFILVRYDGNGSLDETFGQGGIVTTDFGMSDSARDLAFQPDGKIVAAGVSSSVDRGAVALARYNTNGTLDSTFGNGGRVLTEFREQFPSVRSVALQADGKIVAAGNAYTTSNDSDFALLRYNTNGALDSTFGNGGRVLTDFPSSSDSASDVAIQTDGKIVAAGHTGVFSSRDFGVARYNPDGSLDTSFGIAGKRVTDFGGDDQAWSLGILPDNRIVVAGTASYNTQTSDFALAGYTQNGSPDPGFGNDGRITTNFNARDEARGMVVAADGRFTVAGQTGGESNPDFALARYTTTLTGTPTPTPTPTHTPIPASCQLQFADVPDTHTFYASVRCLACRGIISGYADGTFKPDNLVTRGQLAKIVSNAANFTESPGAQIFQDVPTDHTFYEWINRLTNRGYMSGYNCGNPGEPCVNNRPYFRPFNNATRAQTSKIVANAARYNDPPTGQTFEDVPPTHPFYTEIQRLASRNIMGGYNCGSPGEPCILPLNRPYFRPYNDVTRGQSSKIVANTFHPNCSTP